MTRADLIGLIDDVMQRGAAAWSRDDMGTTALEHDAAVALKEAHRQLMAAPVRPVATYLLAFLRQLTAELPPPSGGWHGLAYDRRVLRSAFDEYLALSVWVNGRRVTVRLDNADFEQPVDELAAAVLAEAGRIGKSRGGDWRDE